MGRLTFESYVKVQLKVDSVKIPRVSVAGLAVADWLDP